MRVVYHPRADAELLDPARHYSRVGQTLVERFLSAYEAAVGETLEAPERWMLVEHGVRCHALASFPYSVDYQVENDAVRLVAVTHQSRKPGYWRNRLSDPGWSPS
jgi:toxin ParE1/3/4